MILVTGGAGFVGLNVVEQLRARGEQVVVFDLTPRLRFSTGLFSRGAARRTATGWRSFFQAPNPTASFTSPRSPRARIARQGGETVFPRLGETDYIYAPDVASALIALLDAEEPAHRLYHLGTGALPQHCTSRARDADALLEPAPGGGPEVAVALRSRSCLRRLREVAGGSP